MNCKTARGLFSLRLDDGLSYEEQRRHDPTSRLMSPLHGGVSRTSRGPWASFTIYPRSRLPAPSSRTSCARRAIWEAKRTVVDSARHLGSDARLDLLEDPRADAPRWALAASTLGLVVGVSGSMMIFHRSPVPVAAERVEVRLGASSECRSPRTLRPPSPQARCRRVRSRTSSRRCSVAWSRTPTGEADSSSTPNPEWGAGWDPGVHGQAVGYGPTVPRGRAREGSVSIVF